MPPLDVGGATPILLVGEGDQIQGEVWLSNPTGGDIAVKSATLSATLPGGVETGTLQLPSDAAVMANGARRLVIGMGMQPLTPPGTYSASIDLSLTVGGTPAAQSIPATLVVLTAYQIVFAPNTLVFTGVVPGGTVTGSVVVVNRGNAAFTVGPIPDETIYEVIATPRLLGVGAGGLVGVEPATGLAALAGKVTFTNATPLINVGSWADVTFQLTTPGSLAANRHVRVLPRIATQRFAIDLLTA